jgi:hypothetical protein
MVSKKKPKPSLPDNYTKLSTDHEKKVRELEEKVDEFLLDDSLKQSVLLVDSFALRKELKSMVMMKFSKLKGFVMHYKHDSPEVKLEKYKNFNRD